MLRSVELFAGAGGLALGISKAGFRHDAVVEIDRNACETIRTNMRRGVAHVKDWSLFEGDVREFDFSTIPEGLDLLAAGVPCQPWSIGGKHKGFEDDRNLFPHTAEAVCRLRPKAFLIENVKGLTRQTFANYFSYIQFMLRFPEVRRRPREDWCEHRARLEPYVTSGGRGYAGLKYNVLPRLVNAADFGVPQRRERVFIVGFRADLGLEWAFPEETHSQLSLLRSKWITAEYWDQHRVSLRQRPPKPRDIERRLGEAELFPPQPWRTVRDAFVGLPVPGPSESPDWLNHVLQPGARSYVGHTGSPLDEPAKTLKAGDHGVPGGENMISYVTGDVRYFSVREAARLQTFPDSFKFGSSWTENMRQIGNAVPVELGRIIADKIAESLSGTRTPGKGRVDAN